MLRKIWFRNFSNGLLCLYVSRNFYPNLIFASTRLGNVIKHLGVIEKTIFNWQCYEKFGSGTLVMGYCACMCPEISTLT